MMKEQTLEFWVCTSGSGQTCIFVDKPIRDNINKRWKGIISGSLNSFIMAFSISLPKLTWNDDPKILTITIKF